MFFTGVAVLLVHLPIDPFRSIAWFNVAYGVVLLVLLVFLFEKRVDVTNLASVILSIVKAPDQEFCKSLYPVNERVGIAINTTM